MSLVGAVGGVIEEYVRVEDLDLVFLRAKRERDVGVDGFFLSVKPPQVLYQLRGLGLCLGWCGVKLEPCHCIVDGFGRRPLPIVKGKPPHSLL